MRRKKRTGILTFLVFLIFVFSMVVWADGRGGNVAHAHFPYEGLRFGRGALGQIDRCGLDAGTANVNTESLCSFNHR